MRVHLPNPSQVDTVKSFLAESTGLFIEHVEFGRPASGLSMRVYYKDLRGNTQKKQILAPDADDFTDVVVAMDQWLLASTGPVMAGHA